jgi:uncharacterized membrane protein YjjP (DUF1212 family)
MRRIREIDRMRDSLREEAETLHPLREGARDFRRWLYGVIGALVAAAACAALGAWGGSFGRAIVGAIGFGIVGAMLPLASEPRGRNQERFVLGFSVVCGIGGLIFGARIGATEANLPWWTYAIAGVMSAVGGYWLTRRLVRA